MEFRFFRLPRGEWIAQASRIRMKTDAPLKVALYVAVVEQVVHHFTAGVEETVVDMWFTPAVRERNESL